MTDLPEDEWMNPDPITHEDLQAETKTVLATLAREMEKVRDQLYHLNKTHTVSLMAAEIYTSATNLAYTMEHSADVAKALYREVQKNP